MEKIPSRKNNQEQGDFFSGESLAKYCDPKSPEFLDRITDVVVNRIEYAKQHNDPDRVPLYIVQDLLAELRLQDRFNVSDVVTSVMGKIRQREDAAVQAETKEQMSANIRAQADARWTDEGIPDDKIPYGKK